NHDAFAETLVATTPYVFLGLALALGFKAGLFNIGAEGQFYVGGLTGVFVAYSVRGLPGPIEILLALVAGMLGGFIWSGIAGLILALIAVPVVWFLIERTTLGFQLRSVGFNAMAARANGMSVGRMLALSMGISGSLAGLAGIVQILGLAHHMTDTVAAGYGFD